MWLNLPVSSDFKVVNCFHNLHFLMVQEEQLIFWCVQCFIFVKTGGNTSRVFTCQNWKGTSLLTWCFILFFLCFILELFYLVSYFWHVIQFKILSSHLSNLPFKFILYLTVSFCFPVIIFPLIPCFSLKSSILSLKNLKHINHIYLKVHAWQLQYLDTFVSITIVCFFYLFLMNFCYFYKSWLNARYWVFLKNHYASSALIMLPSFRKKLTLALKIFIQIGIEMIGGCTSIFVITTLFHFPLPLRPIASKALKVSHTCPLSHAWNSNSLTPAMIL